MDHWRRDDLSSSFSFFFPPIFKIADSHKPSTGQALPLFRVQTPVMRSDLQAGFGGSPLKPASAAVDFIMVSATSRRAPGRSCVSKYEATMLQGTLWGHGRSCGHDSPAETCRMSNKIHLSDPLAYKPGCMRFPVRILEQDQ